MNIGTAMYKLLSGTTGLTALVGKRIYPLVMPQKTKLPAVLLYQASQKPVGAFQADTGLYTSVFSITSFAKTKTSAAAIEAQLQTALQDYSGTMGGAGGVAVQHVTYEITTEAFDEATETFTKEIEVTIWHN